MRRRDIITLVGGAAIFWPFSARAQRIRRIPKIGMLLAFSGSDPELGARVEAFNSRLKQLGWSAGTNVQIEYRYAGSDIPRLQKDADDLIGWGADVILAQSNPGLAAVHRINRTIPTVFVQVADPVGGGFVESLARPGGLITGFTNFEPATGGKWVELLKELAPSVNRVAILMHADTAANVAMLKAAADAGPAYGVSVIPAAVTDASSIERVLAEHAREPRGGVVALPHVVTAGNRELIASLAIQHMLPCVGAFAFMAKAGCLAAYGIDVVDLFSRSASYVDRILRGTKPSELPVQAPTKFELVVNLKTASRLGLTVPAIMLGRADEVVE